LNPIARNYFILAGCYEINQEESETANINYGMKKMLYEKVIEINPNFACAHNNLGNLFKELKNYDKAIQQYRKCVSINPTHWAYSMLWYCQDKVGRNAEAFETAKKGYTNDEENKQYLFKLGVSSCRLYDFYKGKRYFEDYLTFFPDDSAAIANLRLTQECLRNKIIRDALDLYESNDFEGALVHFNEYLQSEGVLSQNDLFSYLVCLLKQNNPKIQIDENNPIYIELDELRINFHDKVDENEIPSDDEQNANKLMLYRSNYKLGFGKYEGLEIKEVVEKDPHHILWCIINLKHFAVENNIFLNVGIKNEPYIVALEYNLIKLKLIAQSSHNGYNYDDYDKNVDYTSAEDYGYDSWDDMAFNVAFEGDIDAWNEYNQ
jgi:tetratricopeptide (TPR) repeat protein